MEDVSRPKPKGGKAAGVIMLIAVVGGGMFALASNSGGGSNTAPPPAQNTIIDHSKPWFLKAGWPLCATEQDLDAFRDNANDYQQHSLKEPKVAHCVVSGDGWPVREVDHKGALFPDYQVRLTNVTNQPLVWTPGDAVRN